MCLLALLCKKKVSLKKKKFYHFKEAKLLTDIYMFLDTVTNVPSFQKITVILENDYLVTPMNNLEVMLMNLLKTQP